MSLLAISIENLKFADVKYQDLLFLREWLEMKVAMILPLRLLSKSSVLSARALRPRLISSVAIASPTTIRVELVPTP